MCDRKREPRMKPVAIEYDREGWDSPIVYVRLRNLAEADKFLADQRKLDRKGVEAGRYHILS